jgi:hypothetical protein
MRQPAWMMLNFNMLLADAGLRTQEVRLLRHQQVSRTHLTPYALWRDDPAEFERYQSAQQAHRRPYFASRYWAGFVVPPDGSTLFVGLYEVGEHSPVPSDWIDPLHRETSTQMGRELDIYAFERLTDFDPLIGCLKVNWGDGKRSWAQRADSPNGNKRIVELTQAFREPDFPGYTAFIGNLASLPTIPAPWIAALSAARGIYLLTCPRTREQYVGAAYGTDGFWGRWQAYVATGHGGNEGLKSRDPSDYQISILEVAGSAAATDDIIAMEQLWKAKLQSREMGLNRN